MAQKKQESAQEIREGRARILFPEGNQVFYNPVQEFNRDLSVAVIKHYSNCYWSPSQFRHKGPFWLKAKESKVAKDAAVVKEEVKESSSFDESNGDKGSEEMKGDVSTVSSSADSKLCGLKILEALAASGLRSIRYALEVPAVGKVVTNDISEDAYQSICRNIQANDLQEKIIPSCKDASMLMYECRDPTTKRFDVIDLDPYGSPAQFLDSTLQAVADGGLLCITCTDMGVLCGNNGETCHAKYGSVSIKAKYCHEMALRIILASLESHANRYKRYIFPLLSCSIDFYCRVFVLVYTSASEVKKSASKLSMIYHCNGCGNFHFQPLGKRTGDGSRIKFSAGCGPPVDRLCEQCGSTFKLGGPIWTEPIHHQEFVQSLLSEVKETKKDFKTSDRIMGLLTVVSEELPDIPLYHILDELCSTLHATSMKMLAFRSALLALGYQVSISHAQASAIKTNAPHSVVWDIMRCWVQQNPVKVKPNSPAAQILTKKPEVTTSFIIRPDANPPSRLLKLARFPGNPEPNWGPKSRAKRKATREHEGLLGKKKQKLQLSPEATRDS